MPPIPTDALTFFKSSSDLRRWLEKTHDTASELWIGFYKVGSGKGGVTYKEALDQALCFGWIDGVRKRIDDDSFTIRFSPRKTTSIWSQINIKRAGELTAMGLVKPPGVRAFEARDEKRTHKYSFENRPQTLPPAYQKQFKANRKAWAFFEAQPPYYRRLMTWWIVSAVKDETRLKRLGLLIDRCAQDLRIDLLAPRGKGKVAKPSPGVRGSFRRQT